MSDDRVVDLGDSLPGGLETLGRVFDASVDGMIVVDRDGVVLLANPAALRLFGREGGVIGTTFGFPVNLGVTTEIEVLNPDGPRAVAMRCSQMLLDDASSVRVIALHDVTDRVRAERALHDSMRAREELLAIASHEIRSPLAVISGLAEALRDQYETLSDADRRHMIERVAERSRRLSSLAEELLDRAVSGSELHADVERIAVRPALERALEPFPDIDARLSVPQGAEILADESQVVEIFSNLADNARKYGADPLEIEVTSSGSWAEIRVTDHGDGVPAEFVGTLFDPFTRSDAAAASEATGTGLGLSIVRKLVAANYGNIWYEQAPHGGASFVVRLPTASARRTS